jgi:hypothetical protein
MGTRFSLLNRWRHAKGISKSTSTIETDWKITRQREEKEIKAKKTETNPILLKNTIQQT